MKKIPYQNLVLLALVFFVLYRSFFSLVMWQDRAVPPEPDDSYSYIAYTVEILQNPLSFFDSSSYIYATFNLFFTILNLLLPFSMEIAFQLNFYIGIIFLSLVIYSFLNVFIKKEKNILLPLGIFFLALYNGSGAYHGFYWVVPTFYLLAFFLLLFAQIFKKRDKKWLGITLFLSLLFIGSHPLALYSCIIFAAFFAFYTFFSKKVDKELLKKTAIILSSCMLSFLLLRIAVPKIRNIALKHFLGDPVKTLTEVRLGNSLKTVFASETEGRGIILNFDKLLPALSIILKEYFKILFPHPLFILFFMIGVGVLAKYKEYRILSLYLACLSFVLLSSVHLFGYRSLLFLWPVTFLLFAYFIVYLFKLVKKSNFSYLANLVIGGGLGFAILVSWYNFHWAKVMNKRKDINWDRSCGQYLLQRSKPEDFILYENKLSRSAFYTQGLFARKFVYWQTLENYKYDYKRFPVKFAVLEAPFEKLSLTGKNEVLIKECGAFNIYKLEVVNEN